MLLRHRSELYTRPDAWFADIASDFHFYVVIVRRPNLGQAQYHESRKR